MDIYTRDATTFQKKDIIDDFVSIVWTDRYTEAGECRLVVKETADMKAKLYPGVFLSIPESDEVMILETRSIEDGLLTLSGPSLLGFLKNRFIYDPVNEFVVGGEVTAPRRVQGYNWIDNEVGEIITLTVRNFVIEPSYYPAFNGDDPDLQLDWDSEMIPNLILDEDCYIGTDPIAYNMPLGTSLYDAIQGVADIHKVGIRLYLADDTSPHVLKFLTYIGLDRTSDQEINPLVRFSPHLDSLSNLKELHSVAGYKNAAYAQQGTYRTEMAVAAGIGTPTGWNRRSIFVEVSDIEEGTEAAIAAQLLEQKAKDALANNNFIRLFDGEVVPQEGLEYGTHYKLGDLIELQDVDGSIQKARVTEYIRAQDNTGERTYPTVSVIS